MYTDSRPHNCSAATFSASVFPPTPTNCHFSSFCFNASIILLGEWLWIPKGISETTTAKRCNCFVSYLRRKMLNWNYITIREGADKSLARPTSPCRTMESIVSLERRVCSCAELQDCSCYRGWKEVCQATRAISTTWRRELSSGSFFLQGKAPKEIHVILTEKLGEHAPSYAP